MDMVESLAAFVVSSAPWVLAALGASSERRKALAFAEFGASSASLELSVLVALEASSV